MLVLDGKNLPAMHVMVELAFVLELTPEKANEIFFNRIIRDTYKKERYFGDGKKRS